MRPGRMLTARSTCRREARHGPRKRETPDAPLQLSSSRLPPRAYVRARRRVRRPQKQHPARRPSAPDPPAAARRVSTRLAKAVADKAQAAPRGPSLVQHPLLGSEGPRPLGQKTAARRASTRCAKAAADRAQATPRGPSLVQHPLLGSGRAAPMPKRPRPGAVPDHHGHRCPREPRPEAAPGPSPSNPPAQRSTAPTPRAPVGHCPAGRPATSGSSLRGT